MPGPPASGAQNTNGQGVRVAELVSTLSYAADLGLGQPLAHCMRQTVIALRLADLVGATQDERAATYYLGLMISAFCHADAAEQARWFGDDIAFKADAFEMFGKNTAQIVAFAVRRAGSHGTGWDRARRIVTLPRSGMRQVMDFVATHARLSSRFAEQIGLDDGAVASFRQAYEQWDGKGVPLGLHGSEITLPSRLVQLAGPVEVYARLHGVEAARAAVGRSSGADLDPAVARLFREHAPQVLNGLDEAAEWTAILDAEPSLARRVDGADLDTVLEAMPDLADLKSPQFAGHSRGVANLAAEAARVPRTAAARPGRSPVDRGSPRRPTGRRRRRRGVDRRRQTHPDPEILAERIDRPRGRGPRPARPGALEQSRSPGGWSSHPRPRPTTSSTSTRNWASPVAPKRPCSRRSTALSAVSNHSRDPRAIRAANTAATSGLF